MKTKTVSAILVALFFAGIFVLPAAAPAPDKTKAVQVGNLIMLVTKTGWRQWKLDGEGNVIRFANCLFAEGMKQKVIDAHVANGWLAAEVSDARYPYISHGDLDTDGDVGIIYKFHDIPAGP